MENNILTYGLKDDQGNKVDFILKDIGEIFDQLNGISDRPHRHDYYTIILTEKGCGSHSIDFRKFEIENHSLHFVYPGQVHQVNNPERPSGWVMNFTQEFLIRNHITQNLIDQVYLYNTYGDSPPLHLNADEFTRFKNITRQLQEYSYRNISYQYEALGAVLKLFFINISSLCSISKQNAATSYEGIGNLLVNFKKLISSNYHQWHKVTEYANELAVSSDYLNKYVKSNTNKSAKEFIQDRIIVEAKRMLLFTDKSNKELAYELGFEEPAHFSNFFKKIAEQTPGRFRIESRQQ